MEFFGSFIECYCKRSVDMNISSYRKQGQIAVNYYLRFIFLRVFLENNAKKGDMIIKKAE